MPSWLKQSTSVDVGIGPFLDESDGKTIENTLTITQADIRLKKNGGNWAQKNAAQTLSHEENGWYELTLDATDTGTLGLLIVAIHESGALPVWKEYMVVPAMIYDSIVAGSDRLDTNVTHVGDTAQTAGDIIADTNDIQTRLPAALVSGRIDASVGAMAANVLTATAINADAITAAKIADGAIDAATFAADVDAEILSYIVDDATRIDASALNTASGTTIPAIVADTNELQTDWVNGGRLDLLLDATLADTNELQTDWVNGGRLDLLLDATLADTNELQTDWVNGGRLDLILDARASQTSVDTVDDFLDTEIGAIKTETDKIAAVKAKTDSLTFTNAGVVDANITHVISDPIQANGANDTEWGGAP